MGFGCLAAAIALGAAGAMAIGFGTAGIAAGSIAACY